MCEHRIDIPPACGPGTASSRPEGATSDGSGQSDGSAGAVSKAHAPSVLSGKLLKHVQLVTARIAHPTEPLVAVLSPGLLELLAGRSVNNVNATAS